MALTTGWQYARTLETGDRYITTDLDNNRHEVTVSTVTEHLDDSNSVRNQYADPVDHAHYTYSAVVHVTYRAPRCPHGHDWRWCERRPCVDCEWPAEIDTAYMGNAPARTAA
ncbi:hypothetical protein PV415_29710 [Streptomyces sp. ME03-5684b]|uniref:hypothetical protein n=1 Tax=Streptomyces sp. ME03-5684b TaxID=3028681 RepID=UPI0029A62601|nr:hypothetical protein [Streptomyces sp. ME03-5684b]MDX3321090.1 hypothetical protein [Streptomyces sp. ME03-5684b]